jgi:hypothetical protein
MRALSAAELLATWERGAPQRPVQRALELLTAACPEASAESLAHLSIGQRDARLLTLRQWTFGPHLDSVVVCPRCGERLEVTFKAADVGLHSHMEPTDEISLCVSGYDLRFRIPNSLDVAEAAEREDGSEARRLLLNRCLLAAHCEGAAASCDQLPPDVVDAVEARLAQADPQADIHLAIACSICGHEWLAAFDIASFFWSEIEAWVWRLLREVHTLASAYGWREADIIALSPMRRNFYLEMVGA